MLVMNSKIVLIFWSWNFWKIRKNKFYRIRASIRWWSEWRREGPLEEGRRSASNWHCSRTCTLSLLLLNSRFVELCHFLTQIESWFLISSMSFRRVVKELDFLINKHLSYFMVDSPINNRRSLAVSHYKDRREQVACCICYFPRMAQSRHTLTYSV